MSDKHAFVQAYNEVRRKQALQDWGEPIPTLGEQALERIAAVLPEIAKDDLRWMRAYVKSLEDHWATCSSGKYAPPAQPSPDET